MTVGHEGGPTTLLRRVRNSFAAFLLALSILTIVVTFTSGANVPTTFYATLGTLLYGAWIAIPPRHAGGLWTDLLGIGGQLAMTAAVGVDRTFVLVMAMVMYRGTRGSPAAAGIFAAVSFGIHETLRGSFGPLSLVLGLAVLASVALTASLVSTVVRVDRRTYVDEVLTRVSARLWTAATREEAYDVAVDGVAQLARSLGDLIITLWRSDGEALMLSAVSDARERHVPRRIPLATLPAPFTARLRAGRPFAMPAEGVRELAELVGVADPSDQSLVVPIASGGRTTGALAFGYNNSIVPEVRDGFVRLATLTGLAIHASDGRSNLRASEARYRMLAETGRDGLYVVRPGRELRFEYVNPALERLTGYPAQEFLTNPDLIADRLHPEDDEEQRRRRSNSSYLDEPIDLRWRLPDGRWRVFSVSEVPVDPAHGEPLVIQGVVVDVTDQRAEERARRRAFEAARDAAIELRRVDQLKSAFLQAVSHELRTPLTALLGHATTLDLRGGVLPPGVVADMTAAVARNARRLDRLLTDLLDVDRLSRGVIEPRRAEVSMPALVDAVMSDIDANNHDIVTKVADVTAYIDGPKVERIIDNLVRNALKHTDAGTTVVVAVEREGNELRLTVEDDGPGIDDRAKVALFAPFAQGERATGIPSPGTGIGLALVERFAALHGGEAWAEDSDTGGARFCVVLKDVGHEVHASA